MDDLKGSTAIETLPASPQPNASESDETPLALAEAARRDGNPLAVYDLAQNAIEEGDPHPRFRYLQVLALAQMGDTQRAEQLYDAYRLGEWSADEDALALRGRLHKDRAFELTGRRRQRQFELASAAYLRACDVRSGYFPMINAATTAWAAGDAERARTLAERVLDQPEVASPGSFFAAASAAEALVILGRTEEACQVIAAALAKGGVGHGDRASACRQLSWLCTATKLPAAAQAALLGALRPPPVVTFTGHMYRAGDDQEAPQAARIAAELDALGSTVAYGALACGADILIAEEILRRGGELHVVLPFLREDFVEVSVRPGGEAWVARFDACMRLAASVTLATRMEYVRHNGQFAYGSLLAMGLAQLRARQIATSAVQIAVWDGLPARGESGAGIDVAVWRGLKLETRVIDPGPVDRALDRPDVPAPSDQSARVVRAIIFSDYKGYSQLPEAAIPTFNREVMGRIADVLDRHSEAVCSRNTWGDALYAVIMDTASAAEIVLEIVESLRGVRIESAETDDREGMRIGLHFGPVYQEVDRVTRIDSFYGSEVTLTARIEPKAIPGEIYTTQAFAAILAVTEPSRFACHYVGKIELAKGYGVLPIYQLERGAPRPR